jgi:hypothetical protein
MRRVVEGLNGSDAVTVKKRVRVAVLVTARLVSEFQQNFRRASVWGPTYLNGRIVHVFLCSPPATARALLSSYAVPHSISCSFVPS